MIHQELGSMINLLNSYAKYFRMEILGKLKAKYNSTIHMDVNVDIFSEKLELE